MKTNKINIEKIKNSIVIIYPENKLIKYNNNPKWIISEYKNSWIWAGFFIHKNWLIQTANHLVENDKIEYNIIYNNKKYKSKIISRNIDKDSAVLKIITDKNQRFPILVKENNELILWESIYSFWVNINNLDIIYNTWILLNKKSKIDNISNLLEISNTLKPGFSWWPIINSKWKIIWINYAISEWKNYGLLY